MKRFLFLSLVLAGCGGEGEKMTTSPFPPPPPVMMMSQTPAPSSMQPTQAQRASASAKCETFISVVCGRSADCAIANGWQGARTEWVAECTSGAKTSLDCGAAVGVSESYDRCIKDMSEQSCTLVLDPDAPFPASCTGVILVR